jgi:hypothetical protein
MNEQQSSGPAIRKCSPGVFSAEARRYANADDVTHERVKELFQHNVKDWEKPSADWGILSRVRHALLRDWKALYGKAGAK